MALGASLSLRRGARRHPGRPAAVDLIFARFIVAGLIMLPRAAALRRARPCRDRLAAGAVLTALGGALFALLQTGGYGFAPLAHGAVIAPSTVTIVSTIGAALFLRERLSRNHLVGAAIVLGGIVLIGWDGLVQPAGERAWLGDLLFFCSSVLWACFTLLLRHWRVPACAPPPWSPCCRAWWRRRPICCGPGRRISRPCRSRPWRSRAWSRAVCRAPSPWSPTAQAVMLLGVSRAVLFPAIVPAVSVLVGIPIVGEIPSVLQIGGLALVTLGLLTTVGMFRWFTGR